MGRHLTSAVSVDSSNCDGNCIQEMEKVCYMLGVQFSLILLKLIEATPSSSLSGILYSNEQLSFMSHFFKGICEWGDSLGFQNNTHFNVFKFLSRSGWMSVTLWVSEQAGIGLEERLQWPSICVQTKAWWIFRLFAMPIWVGSGPQKNHPFCHFKEMNRKECANVRPKSTSPRKPPNCSPTPSLAASSTPCKCASVRSAGSFLFRRVSGVKWEVQGICRL